MYFTALHLLLLFVLRNAHIISICYSLSLITQLFINYIHVFHLIITVLFYRQCPVWYVYLCGEEKHPQL